MTVTYLASLKFAWLPVRYSGKLISAEYTICWP